MPISFELTESSKKSRDFYNDVARNHMRPISRKYDVEEHKLPTEWVDYYWNEVRLASTGADGPSDGFVQICVQAEELCWGDAGLYLRMPTAALGGSAVGAAGTKEQKERFLKPFREPGQPIWGAMAITEPSAGSDSAAIEATATYDEATDEYAINGNKIFCTAGEGASTVEGGFVVVWATVDKSAGRAGIKSFVVPAGTPGMKLVGLEKKLGIRVSDTATLMFENCRVPAANLRVAQRSRRRTPRSRATRDSRVPWPPSTRVARSSRRWPSVWAAPRSTS